ncbi:MAG: DUF4234 domain-containing protein [Oscillospiraceae bacterium]|nr:DUF4234 domain-containing protein [Oscillospiraceae bacterium]
MAEQPINVTINSQSTQGAPFYAPPSKKMKTNRGGIKFYILTIVTLGIYAVFFYAGVANDINLAATKYDGKKTMNFWLLFLLVGPITFGLGYLVWGHKLAARIGAEARRRGHSTTFGAGSYWLWNTLGLIIIIGPFVYMHKLSACMNAIAQDYNEKG